MRYLQITRCNVTPSKANSGMNQLCPGNELQDMWYSYYIPVLSCIAVSPILRPGFAGKDTILTTWQSITPLCGETVAQHLQNNVERRVDGQAVPFRIVPRVARHTTESSKSQPETTIIVAPVCCFFFVAYANYCHSNSVVIHSYANYLTETYAFHAALSQSKVWRSSTCERTCSTNQTCTCCKGQLTSPYLL